MGNGAAKVTFKETDISFFVNPIADIKNGLQITARRGPVNEVKLVGSLQKFREIYGVDLASSDSGLVVKRALDRGARLYLNRVVHYTDPADPTTKTSDIATITLKNAAGTDTIELSAANDGAWGNNVIIKVVQNTADSNRWDLYVTLPEQPDMNELHVGLSMNNSDPRYAVSYINANSLLLTAVDKNSGNPFVGDTVTVDNTTLTAGTDFAVDATNIPAMAAALAAKIETAESAVNATSNGNVVTVTAASSGTGGNSIALSRTTTGSNITVSGANLTGGAAAIAATGTVTYGSPSNSDTITVAGQLFTKVAATPGANEFSTIGELTTLINNLSQVNATDNGSVITVTAATAGTAGNAITMSKSGSALTLSGATLTGGAAATSATGTITLAATPTVIDNPAPVNSVSMTGGNDGLSGIDDDDWIGDSAAGTGLGAFNDVDDIYGIGCPEASSEVVTAAGIAYAESRQDLVFYCEPPATAVTAEDAIDFRKGEDVYSHPAFNSSYGAMYFGRPKVRSSKTDALINISNLGDVFGVHAYSDQVSEVWYAPAGFNRGRVPNTLGIHYNVGSPGRSAELDALADNGINPIVSFPNDGAVVWDEKTLQTLPSALQSLHIRRLLIYMKKALLKANRAWLFEPNDPVTWRKVFNMIDPWMNDLLSRRAFYEYRVQCDQDAKSIGDAVLNTPERVDRGEFRCRLFIKPTRTLYYFGIEAVITKTSTNFQELLNLTNV
jgi:hypothetical protein